jgi:hypothetical protein
VVLLVLATAAAHLGLRLPLAVRLSAVMVFRLHPLLRRGLRTRSRLRLRVRLAAAKATAIELMGRRLRGATGPRTLRHAVHLVFLIEVLLRSARRFVVDSTTAWGTAGATVCIRASGEVVVSRCYMRWFVVRVSSGSVELGTPASTGSSGRTITTGFGGVHCRVGSMKLAMAGASTRSAVARRVAANTSAHLRATRGSRRTIISARKVCCLAVTGTTNRRIPTVVFGTGCASGAVISASEIARPVARSAVVGRVDIWTTSRASGTGCMFTTAVIRRTSSPRGDSPFAREHARALSRSDRRLTAVHGGPQVVVTEGCVLVLSLHCSKGHMVIMFCYELAAARACLQAAFTTVVTHPSHVDVVDDRLVVDVGDVNVVDVRNRTVVVERAVIPVTALETNTAVPESVVDAAVESDVRTPIAGVPNV